MTARVAAFLLGVAVAVPATVLLGQGPSPLPDAIAADSKTYSVEFENDIVRVLRVRLARGVSTPRHAHSAYCAIEISDSTLREPNGSLSESKAGQVFCGDALSHAPSNIGTAVAESVVVEFKGRQKAR